MGMAAKRKAAFAFAALLLALLFAPVGRAYAQSAPTREIALVYDDSGSMIFSQGTYRENWYRAKYAMEVFAAMMDTGDRMTVFPMSFYRNSVEGSDPPITLKGSQTAEERVQTIHTMNHDYRGTPFNSVRAACQFLQESDSQGEKWLVILTDGDFEGAPSGGVEAYLRAQAGEIGLKVIYLAMGSEAASISTDEDAGLYSYQAADSQAILSAVTQVANQVFSRRALPAQRVEVQGETVTIDLDVPVTQIIFFAQGQDVAVGSMSSADGSGMWTARTKTSVKYSDAIPPNYNTAEYTSRITFDDSLQGMLADLAPQEPIAAGRYVISVSGASQVEVYYTPYVSATLWLTDSSGNVVPLSADGTVDLYSGLYTAQLCLVDPLTGQKIDSDLVQLLSAQVEMYNNGEALELDGLEDGALQLKLDKGELSGSVQAQLDGYQTVTSDFAGTVKPALWQGQLAVQLPQQLGQGHYRQDRLEGAEPILVEAEETDPDTGETGPLSRQDWENARFTVASVEWDSLDMPLWESLLRGLYEFFYCRGENGLEWQAERAEQVSAFTVTPRESGAPNVRWGKATLELRLESEGEDHSFAASQSCVVLVAPVPLAALLPGLAPIFGGFAAFLVLFVFWIRKKRLPRGLCPELHVHRYSIGALAGKDEDFKVSIRRKFSLFSPETATIDFSVAGVLSVPVMKIRATERTGKDSARRFCILNLQEYAQMGKIQPVTLNGQMIQKDAEKKPQRVNCQLDCKGNSFRGTGKAPDCTLRLRYDKQKNKLFGGRKKPRRKKRRRR